jgi:type VI secretion system FHA domain protein
MLILQVSQPMQPGAPALQGHFDERGGTIGRAAECTLMLPDPEKHISRVQAEVRYSGGQYALLNRSSVNPLTLNGHPLHADEAQPLRAGDEIVIAQFVLRVELSNRAYQPNKLAIADDPFADLIPRTQLAKSPAPRLERPLSGPTSGAGQAYIPEDAFADLERFAPTPEPVVRASPRPVAVDPFAAPSRSMHDLAPAVGQSANQDPLHLGAFEQANESIDDLFGLGSAASDPLAAGSPLGDPSQRSARGSTAPGAMPDRVPEIHAAVKLPKLKAANSGELYRSWDKPESPKALSAQALASVAEQSANAHKLDFEPTPTTRTTAMLDDLNRHALSAAKASAVDGAHRAAGNRPGDDADFTLLKAFLLGSGLTELPRAAGAKDPRMLDAAIMQRIGELLKLHSQGTVELLASRALTKKEMRAEVTVIVAKNNNPLKFSPDAGGALAHMLAARPLRGFMEGPAAVRDAFDDLIAHQVGFVAGMRAAMQGLISRFDPKELEKRLKQRSMIDTMLPMNRKAKLWELFNELFGELAREAEDDFEALFGREFLRAYDEQIERLNQKDKP